MLQHESRVTIVDNSGAKKVMVIQKLGGSNKGLVRQGQVAVVVVKDSDLTRKKTHRSTIHRALVIRSKISLPRTNTFRIRFDETAAILVNKKNLPLGSRIRGPVLQELCEKFPFIGTLSQVII
jgi:large subunit ribosomal protein L14|uniref:Ribosomal protein L14 n=1 Tax=Vermamoeba vermiformis TaxID=5778 RepID=D4PBJ4_VERVE|nr:ribosomal protein L14 [Vermamoeba vermiformis]ADD62206.1 ribosomal protein L14 [Vermamoeba vermiformis]